jgi:hypothetical protein
MYYSTDWSTLQTLSDNIKITISLNMDTLNSEVLKDILTEAKVLLMPGKLEAVIPNVA